MLRQTSSLGIAQEADLLQFSPVAKPYSVSFNKPFLRANIVYRKCEKTGRCTCYQDLAERNSEVPGESVACDRHFFYEKTVSASNFSTGLLSLSWTAPVVTTHPGPTLQPSDESTPKN